MSIRKILAVLGTGAVVAFLAVVSTTSVSVIQGQATDVGTDVDTGDRPPIGVRSQPFQPPSTQPPATTLPPTLIDQPGAEQSPAASQLPSAGSAGLLNQSGGVQAWVIIMAIGAAFLVGIGGIATLRHRQR